MTHVLYANAGLPTNDPRHWIVAPLAFPTRFKGWPAKLEGGRIVTEFEQKATGDETFCRAIQAAASAMYDMHLDEVEATSQRFMEIERAAYAERRRAERDAKARYDATTETHRDLARRTAQTQAQAVLAVLPRL